jgi:hypothetical protein
VRYFRLIFIAITLAWAFGAIAALLDQQVANTDKKLAVIITATGCWGVVASWKYIWNKK